MFPDKFSKKMSSFNERNRATLLEITFTLPIKLSYIPVQCNTRIYTLSSIPMTRPLLLGNAIISNKANPCSGSMTAETIKWRKSKLININNFVIYSNSISKTTKNVLPWICSLKFENSLNRNKLSICIFHSTGRVSTAEKVQIKYFVQNKLVKSHSSM